MSKKIGAKVFGIKGAGIGAECTPDMLAKINGYALTALTTEQVFVRKFLMAHNCIDRDNECFPADMLDQFAVTMPGKSMLVGHNRRDLPCGKFFDATTEEMTCEQFKSLTGEEPRMPEGMDRCKVLWAWAYMVKTPGNEELTQQIDGGVCSHCSIGFAAADLTAIRKDPNGPALYYQYVSPGEALEGSLVWLGAQPGATAQKALTDQEKHKTEVHSMKTIVALLVGMGIKSLVADATEEQVAAGIKSLIEGKDAEIAKLKALEPLAEEGKSYRNNLVVDAVKFGTLLEEIPGDADGQKKESDFLATLPLDRLKMTRDKYEAAARAKFPTHTVFTGKSQDDREQRGKEGEQRTQETKGKKDFSRPENNELFSTIGK
jgi:hypothetical protein